MKKITWFIVLFLYVLINSCQKREFSIERQEEYAVAIDAVHNLANLAVENFNDNIGAKARAGKSGEKRVIQDITPYPSKSEPTFYIINYKNNGGFILLAADKRSIPVLASSATGNFNMDGDLNPELMNWVEMTDSYINNIGSENRSDKNFAGNINALWDGPCPSAVFRGIDPGFSINTTCELEPCPYPEITIAPKINSIWDQGAGYNNALDYMGCTYYSNGKPPVGCVATAMGQVMKYYQHPLRYNWNAMPLTSPSNETALLMKDIGNSVNMDYGCLASGANTEATVANAFRSTFGYSSAKFMDFVPAKMISELQEGRVIIMRGGENSGGQYINGHAWVVEGARQVWVCNWNWDTGEVTGANSYAYGYMNWGWYNGNQNGYYQTTHLVTSVGTFNYKTGMVYDIRP